MQISITYDDRAARDFDTGIFASSEPFKAQGINGMTEIVPRFDLLFKKEDPVFIIDFYWYNFRVESNSYSSINDENGVKMFHAQRQAGVRVEIADTSEVEHIVTIEKDGKLVAWRQAGDLVDGIKFANQEVLCFSSQTTDSINEKAGSIYEYISNAHPGMSQEDIASMMGYSVDGINLILSDEFKNKGFNEEDPEAAAEKMAVDYMDAQDEAENTEDVGEDGSFDDEEGFAFEEDESALMEDVDVD